MILFMSSRRKLLSFVCVSWLFCWLSPVLAAPTDGKLEWDKRVVNGTLENGFRYYLFDSRQDETSTEGLTIANLLVLAGAIDEEEDQLGVAHMVEHMVFHESNGLPDGVRKALTDLGLKQGRGFNAMTNSENTRYMVNLRDTTPENLDSLLNIYQQMAFQAQIKAESLVKERLIIEEEWRGKLSHRSRINEDKKAILRVGSLYSERPVIGTQDSIQHTPAERLQAFYRDWYAPNNMALIIFAPTDMKALEAKIQSIFSKEKARTLPQRHPKNPVLDSNIKMGQLIDSGSKINRVAFLYRFDKAFVNTDEGRRDGLINYMTRRLLTQQVRRQRENLPEHVRALTSTKGELTENVDIVGFSVNVDDGFHKKGLTVLAQEIERLKRYGFFQEDFETLFEQVIETTERNKRVSKERGNIWSIKMVEAVALGKPLADPEESNDQALRLIKTVSLEDVNTRLREWLSSPDRVLYTQAVGGESVDLGSPEDVGAVFEMARKSSLDGLESKAVVTEKELPKVKEKGSVELLSRDETIGLSRWRLSNGDQLLFLNPSVLSGSYESEEIEAREEANIEDEFSYFSALSSAGYQVQTGSTWAQQIAQQMSEASGVYGWSDDEFQQWRRNNNVFLSSTQKSQSLIYRGSVRDKGLEKMLGLYYQGHAVTEIAPDVYASVMEDLKRSAGVSVVRPIEAFSRELAKARFGGKDSMVPTLLDLQELTHEYLEEVRQQQVSLPTQYFIVSHMEEAQVLALAAHYLATIPRASSKDYKDSQERFITKKNTAPVLQLPGQRVVDVALNPEPKAEYRLHAYQSLPWSPRAAVQLLYLGERLEDELQKRLRSEVQGVYSVRAVLELNQDTDRAELSIQYSSDPSRLDDLAAMTDDVLATYANSITPEWVEQAYDGFVDIEQNRLRNSFEATLMHRLELSESYYGDARYLKDMKQLKEGLEEEQLKTLAQRLTFENRVKGFYRPLVN